MFLFGRHKSGHERHYGFEGKQEKPVVGQMREKEFGEELARDGGTTALTPIELIPIQERGPPCCSPGVMLAAQTMPALALPCSTPGWLWHCRHPILQDDARFPYPPLGFCKTP